MLLAAGLAVGLLAVATSASAATATLCVKNAANGAVKGPTVAGGNACKAGYDAVTLPGAAELAELDKIMPYVKYESSGIDGKPTILVSGANVQIVAKAKTEEGKENETTGVGNLIVGNDESVRKQTGSNNLVLGNEQEYTSFGGFLAGFSNTASNEWATVSGGAHNTASGLLASISGGEDNAASNTAASVSGGTKNTGSGLRASVSGGQENKAEGTSSSVLGGDAIRCAGAIESCGAIEGWNSFTKEFTVPAHSTASIEPFSTALPAGKYLVNLEVVLLGTNPSQTGEVFCGFEGPNAEGVSLGVPEPFAGDSFGEVELSSGNHEKVFCINRTGGEFRAQFDASAMKLATISH
jgi:hypothetical protein